MDQATQQNAALVEEAAAATASLQDQAHALTELVGTFRLDHQQDGIRHQRSAAVHGGQLALSA
jgi:hypothetical protein